MTEKEILKLRYIIKPNGEVIDRKTEKLVIRIKRRYISVYIIMSWMQNKHI